MLAKVGQMTGPTWLIFFLENSQIPLGQHWLNNQIFFAKNLFL